MNQDNKIIYEGKIIFDEVKEDDSGEWNWVYTLVDELGSDILAKISGNLGTTFYSYPSGNKRIRITVEVLGNVD